VFGDVFGKKLFMTTFGVVSAREIDEFADGFKRDIFYALGTLWHFTSSAKTALVVYGNGYGKIR
jgi:hypothetical protein